MRAAITHFLQGPARVRPSDALRTSFGALAAIAATGLLARAAAGGGPALGPLLVPPIGASAVLAFAIPASPLAQPRAVIGGNVLSAAIGVACGVAIANPFLAAPTAVGVAILAMSLLGCLHPPGAAFALGAALSVSEHQQPADFGWVLAPVALCSVLLVLGAMIYGRLTGRHYPHRAPAAAPNVHGTRDKPPLERVGYTTADLDAALSHYGELLDVSREDLDALFREVESQASQRIHAKIRCEEIMSRDVISVTLDQTSSSALAFMRAHDLRTAPVVDRQGRVVGMVRRAELQAARDRPVEAALDPFVHRVRPGSPIEQLLPLLSSGQTHEAMVVDENRVLVGIITQTDLLAVLYRAHLVESMAVRMAS
jgi:CBS domain-containing membrane protein